MEMSVVDGFLRIEGLRWDAYNEIPHCSSPWKTTAKHMGIIRPECWQHDLPYQVQPALLQRSWNPFEWSQTRKSFCRASRSQETQKLEWFESSERGEIERNFSIGKRRYSLDCIVTKLKVTSEVMIHSIVIYMNLRKRLWLLLRSFFDWLQIAIQEWMVKEKSTFA